ncbi:MAG: PDZ domain-containing protein [Planctomycetales bacterium]|nr:PDZ domain-containing protein [Planctomycetales bacterium]
MLNSARIGFTLSVVPFLALTGLIRPVAAQSAPEPAADSNGLKTVIVEEQPRETSFFNVEGKALLPGQAATESAGKFWIGLRCSNVDGAVRAQLGLAEGKGLIVDEVFPDSPAKNAGLQQYDVLVKIGDRELAAVTDLVESVQKAEKREIEVSLIRAGKPQTLMLTPAERATGGAQTRISIVAKPDANYHQLHTLIEQLQKSGPLGEAKMRTLHPGVWVNTYQQFGALPKGLSISITKSGDEEAKIVVQRGDQKWEATEKSLDNLPEDVRKSVQEFLGRRQQNAAGRTLTAQPGGVGGTVHLHTVPTPFQPTSPSFRVITPAVPGLPLAPPKTPAPDQLQKQLDEIQKQLESLRKSVEALQSKKE